MANFTRTEFLDGRVVLYGGDARDVLKSLPDNSVDAVPCDPPYALDSIRKRFGGENAAPAQFGKDGAFARASRGFMSQTWDTGETAFDPEFWREVFRVLKPGGHVAAFSGTRTYHRMATAIEAAGFEIRDQLAWMYGTGFPKSHNVAKGIDRHLGVNREVVGKETLANDMRNSALLNAGKGGERSAYERDVTVATSAEAQEWDGWGTALKPAWEPICLARKPLVGTVAENVLQFRTGALNVDACRIPAEKPTGWGGKAGGGNTWNESNSGLGKDGEPRPVDGRFPANILHDGSPEVLAAFPSAIGQQGTVSGLEPSAATGTVYNPRQRTASAEPRGDEGSAARFFYTAKADADDRFDFDHPTVKPQDLMRWLCRLLCAKGGVVLDPFAGTGSTGTAAYWEGMDAILVEREPKYQGFIEKRIKHVLSGPDERKRARTTVAPLDAEETPLFADLIVDDLQTQGAK